MSENPIELDGEYPPSPAPSTPRSHGHYSLETEIVYTETTDQYGASSVPLYQSATFKPNSLSNMGEYDYTRSGNPTRTFLERHLSKIMKAGRVLAVSSGMTALDVICRLLNPGDEVIAGDDLYGGTNRLLKYLKTNNGIIVNHVDTTNNEDVFKVVSEKTAMVFLESPTNPLIKVIDIKKITDYVHQHAPKALVVFDNTMLSPMLFNPLDFGADIVYESATKYLNGHHDVMAGVIAVRDLAIGDRLFFVINASGCGLAPFDCFLLMRGLKTLAVRFEKQQRNAQLVAEFLEDAGFKVRYPGLRSHPQYKLHHSYSKGSGGVISFETGNVELSEQIVEHTRIWGISVSFGCVNSLISLPCKMSHASIDAKTRAERHFPEDLIRLCVGIENPDDLIDDLKNSLIRSGAVKVDLDGLIKATTKLSI